jgi:endogenous inhibitor of DNA gyrase (YacG/DUF329 family)
LPERPLQNVKLGYIKKKLPIPEGFVKNCKIHGDLKIDEVFNHHGLTKIYFKCKKCSHKDRKKWLSENPNKVKEFRHKAYLKSAKLNSIKSIIRQKALTINQYNKMFEDQENKCAICNKEETKVRKDGEKSPLCVDHCHKTGLTRQLLCFKCNAGLGMFFDTAETLENAIKYLRKWQNLHLREGSDGDSRHT